MHIFCKFSLSLGEIQIEENFIVHFSSEFEESVQGSDACEKRNDFLEELAPDSDDDEENEIYFTRTLTKIYQEEIKELLKSNDFDRSEIIHTYKMEGFKSSVDVRVDNKSAFTCPSVGGKVFKEGRWKSAKNVVVEVLLRSQLLVSNMKRS